MARRASQAIDPGTRKTINWVGGVLMAIFVGCVVGSIFTRPSTSERLLSIGLICISIATALFAFTFLRNQTANFEVKFWGIAFSLGGALAGAAGLYVILQFGVRGTSSLNVELFVDDEFQKPWQAAQSDAPPEFRAALRDYTVIATPLGNVVRFHNLPVFERVSLSVRDLYWDISKLRSDSSICSVNGLSLTGYCGTAQMVLKFTNCLEKWSGSGEIAGSTLRDVLSFLVAQMQRVRFLPRTAYAFGNDTRSGIAEAISVPSDGRTFRNANFCTAINPFKAELQQKLQKTVNIKMSCTQIGVGIGNDEFPLSNTESWSTTC